MTQQPKEGERVILVHLLLRGEISSPITIEEFHELAVAAGAMVLETVTTKRDQPDAKYYIGAGKVEILKTRVREAAVDLILVDATLTPSQERNLERALQCRVLDRTGLILAIFAKRARSYEGKLQVELVQLKHQSARLVRGWTNLEQQKGGIGLRGPGETQLETDRRLIKGRIKYLEERLKKVRKQRQQGRQSRRKRTVPTCSLVGYTNVGKSTLFNALTGATAWVADQLFATLDPTLRALELPYIGKVICADTVGFVRDLPHGLVEAFKATLEETQEADLVIHVIDSADESREAHIKDVETVLLEIDALAVPRLEVYNKIDLVGVAPHLQRDEHGVIQRVFMSAVTKDGLSLLEEAIVERLSHDMLDCTIGLAASQYSIKMALFNEGVIVAERLQDNGDFELDIRLPRVKWHQLCHQYPDIDLKEEGLA